MHEHPHLRAHHLRWIYGFLKPTQFTIGQTSRIYPGCTRFAFSLHHNTQHIRRRYTETHNTDANVLKMYRNTRLGQVQKHTTRAGCRIRNYRWHGRCVYGRMPDRFVNTLYKYAQSTFVYIMKRESDIKFWAQYVVMGICLAELWTHMCHCCDDLCATRCVSQSVDRYTFVLNLSYEKFWAHIFMGGSLCLGGCQYNSLSLLWGLSW